MIYTSKFSCVVISAITALLLFVSIETRAAYRVKRAYILQTVLSADTASLTERSASNSAFLQTPYIPHRDDTDHHKMTAADRSIVFGSVAAGFSLLGLAMSISIGSISSLSALIGVGMFGVFMPLVFGALAIGYGIKGLKTKKQKTLSIAGLILGGLALAIGVAILAF